MDIKILIQHLILVNENQSCVALFVFLAKAKKTAKGEDW